VSYDVGNPPVLRRFKTSRTKEQIAAFLEETKKTVEAMHQYIEEKEKQKVGITAPRPPAW